MDAHEKIARRFQKVIGGRGTNQRLADALDYHKDTISRMFSGRLEIPSTVVAVLEFLETTEPKDWPKRWKAARAHREAAEERDAR